MTARLAVALVALLSLAGCGGAVDTAAGDVCLPSVLQAGPLPSPYDATPATASPWHVGSGYLAVLDYATDRTSTLVPGTRMPDGTTSRVEVRVASAATGDLTLRGTSTGRTFTQTLPATGPAAYAGDLDVPATGCWDLALSVGDRELGSLTVDVVDPPA
ncbi:MAG: hypothetical protein JWO46_1780 [Nocardioidaceae bacterium]|nr:hypothetical protein [Nocardioidaceae bacterium]